MTLARVFAVALACAAAAMPQDTRVILLGTGTPNPDPERSGPSVAVVSGSHVYVVDCGPGIVRRAVQAGITMSSLTRAFVTHLHSDHTVGLPDLVFTPAVTGRQSPFEIYGPPGLRAMAGHVMEAWKEDIDIRLNGLEHGLPAAYQVTAHDVVPGEVYKDEAVRVVAIKVDHGTWKHAYGYRFEAPDKVIVISGDTTFSESLIKGAAGADILVHEVYSQRGWERRSPDWRKYHAAFHTSGPDVGRVAAKVQPKKLVLYHQLTMGETPDEVVGEVRSQYQGAVIYGNDLDVIR